MSHVVLHHQNHYHLWHGMVLHIHQIVFFIETMKYTYAGVILGMGSANERRRYNVTSSLIGWAHTQNDHGIWWEYVMHVRIHIPLQMYSLLLYNVRCASNRDENGVKTNAIASKHDCYSLQWRHNDHDGVSNHWRLDCLPNRLFTQGKYQRSASLAFVRESNRWPVYSRHKGPETRKMFPFDDAIM